MADLKRVTLKNVELNWAHLGEPSTKGEYASNKYEVQVVVDKEQAKVINELKNSSQDLKKLEDGRYAITLKSQSKPIVMDAKKIRWDVDKAKTIGNGTIANVSVNQYVGFKNKTFLGLNGVMVLDLKEYAGADPFADIEADADDSAPFDSDDDELV